MWICWTPDAGAVMTGAFSGFSISSSLTTGVPHRLQKADSAGIRLPHRLQNDPVGREEVSTGTGMVGAGSTTFFIGRAISIFFFCRGALVISMRRCGGGGFETGACTGGGACSRTGAGGTAETGCWMEVARFWLSIFTQSSHSRFLSPPTALEKVRII
jgi:hypothetical protein